nr:NADH-ubiquinone oxidoreductase chain 2 [Picochlorum sp. 'soloecismus']
MKIIYVTMSSIVYTSTHAVFVVENDIPLMFPVIYLSIATMALLLYGVVASTSVTRHAPVLQVPVTHIALWSLVLTYGLLWNMPCVEASVFYNTQLLDTYTSLFQMGIILATGVSLWCGLGYCLRTRINAYEYVVLILLATQGIVLLVASQDLVGLYLAIELQSLCFYVLAAYARYSEFAVEAGLKYFVLGAFSSGLLLFGASLLYGATGTTNLMDMAQMFAGGITDALVTTGGMPTCELGMILVTVGLLFKLAAAPFHMWSPDVYEGAPTSTTAYFIIVPKIAFMGALLRVLYGGWYDCMDTWQPSIILASGASMLVGAFAPLIQTRIKRLLALSSVGHVGFILAAVSTGTVEGIQALVVYLVIYTIINSTMFTYILGGSTGGESPRRITDFTGLGTTQPLVALTLSIIWFSMAGIPPLAGFYSKVMVFYSTVAGHISTLAVLGVLISVVSCFYYIRVIKVMYFETPTMWPESSRMSYGGSLIQAVGMVCLLGIMLYPRPLEYLAKSIAYTICG